MSESSWKTKAFKAVVAALLAVAITALMMWTLGEVMIPKVHSALMSIQVVPR